MIDIIDKPEQEKESKDLNRTKLDDSFLDILNDIAEASIEIIANIIKD